MNAKLNEIYLLVSFQENSELIQQEILEIATEYAILPYSAPNIDGAIIFKSDSENALLSFKERLSYEDFPISIKTCKNKVLT